MANRLRPPLHKANESSRKEVSFSVHLPRTEISHTDVHHTAAREDRSCATTRPFSLTPQSFSSTHQGPAEDRSANIDPLECTGKGDANRSERSRAGFEEEL